MIGGNKEWPITSLEMAPIQQPIPAQDSGCSNLQDRIGCKTLRFSLGFLWLLNLLACQCYMKKLPLSKWTFSRKTSCTKRGHIVIVFLEGGGSSCSQFRVFSFALEIVFPPSKKACWPLCGSLKTLVPCFYWELGRTSLKTLVPCFYWE